MITLIVVLLAVVALFILDGDGKVGRIRGAIVGVVCGLFLCLAVSPFIIIVAIVADLEADPEVSFIALADVDDDRYGLLNVVGAEDRPGPSGLECETHPFKVTKWLIYAGSDNECTIIMGTDR